MNAEMNTICTETQPFIKWVGGKRGLLSQILPLINTNFNNYFEPFIGGGALFFELYNLGYLKNKKIYLFDINSELINTYNVVKNNPFDLINELKKFKENHSKEFYYEIRAWDRQDNFLSRTNVERATRFIYLNKTCFNGLYRVNKSNQNNVPMGDYKNPNICDEKAIINASKALSHAIILNTSYEDVLNYARENDLIYFDPPYHPLNETANFTSYSEFNFLEKEQIALYEVFNQLSNRSCQVIQSNSYTNFIKNLYKDYQIEEIKANRFINSKANDRGKILEVLIKNINDKRGKFMNFENLKNTLQESIFTWDYFTDFEKVKINVKKVEKELNILNYLIGKKDIEKEFIQLIEEYPNIRKALPLLIAVRKDKLKDTSIIVNFSTLIPENKGHIFFDPLSDEIKNDLLVFFNETGLKDVFENEYIKNLVDYCFGVEVGFDTNARKNRTGTLMENIVSKYLEEFCKKNTNFKYIEQATQKRIKEYLKYDIEIDKNSRRFDFALINTSNNKLYLIEVNYYSSGGSKLKATAGEYKSLHDFIKKQKIDFIWITDGLGWMTALNSLEETFNHNDYVINLDMMKNRILKEILL